MMSSIKLEEMKRNAIITHVHGLQEIKELYNKLRNTTNPKDIASYGQHIVNISKYQESANWQYKNILRQFPESVDILKVYVLFLTDVMNKDDLANKTANRIPREIEEMENKRNSICSNNFKNKKAITLSSNSLASATYSEVPSCISGVSGLGKEIRKKISLKNSMTKKYILPIKQLKVKMTICIILFIIVFGIQALFTIFIFDSIKKNVEMLNTNMCIPGYIKSIAFFIRNLSLNFITGKMYNYYRNNGALIGISGFLAEQNLPIVTAHMDVPTVNPLYIPVGKYSFDTVETISLADAYKKLLSFVKFCLNRGFLSETENMEEILFEPHFRYFLINSIRNMDLVFIRCKEILRDKIINLFGNVTVIIIGLELTLAIITLYIGFITFFPLKKSTKKISFNALKMLKCLSKENYEQITKDYEEKIETLCENYELEKEDIELKNDKGSLFKNIILFFSFIIIIAYIVISGIPVLQTITEVKDIIAISQKSIDRLLAVRTIQMYTYEVINQDKSVFLQDEPQRILKSHLNQLELIQDELKTGSYGGPTFDAYPLLNDVLKEGGCFRYEGNNDCDNMTYDSSYGFSKEIGTLPINELIREYIYNVKNFISNYEKGKYVNVPFSSKENISIIFEEVSNDQFFKLQDSLVDNIVGDLQYINQVIMEHGESLLSQMSEEVTILIGIGVVLFLTIDFFVFNKMYTEKIKEMNALVSFLFLVPPSIINKNEKYKSFLETAQVIE
ncbi:hypothetical protein BCR36DRAFT_149995 [Piromyces finnis]|uniref:TmcB/TmcC TPR repeats domain-containing protein n=1 Tax=Piromyces finnis TaxID=1754191 RepID=A0A1Y1UX95_9FUNG|nr:hypothetical protein BCR36DRAFT_149995 [Piromyces finnis]|eukprot:ORX42838.1 hypothetical protein BCR36DRAFT_149995 [Piromyces finnis]